MTREFGITFGAVTDPLKQQLTEQGLQMSPQPLKRLQHVMDACTSLTIGGWLSDAEAHKVRTRIIKGIRREVEKTMSGGRKP